MAKSDQGIIARWVACHYFGGPLRYVGFGGRGKQVRDFLHVDDFRTLILDQGKHVERYQGKRFKAWRRESEQPLNARDH